MSMCMLLSELYVHVLRFYRELSRGDFTDDNQHRLKTPNVDAAVFRAWILGDVRLVYYIDCVDNPEADVRPFPSSRAPFTDVT
jgi:hypothetical protein